MATMINTKELYGILDSMPSSQNIMLSGKHGIGKSRILTDYFSKKGMKVVSLFLGQMSDPGDLIGLPDRDSSAAETRFLPPYWFPKDDTPLVLFLDELNRARPEVLQAIMDLALNRTIAGRSLPKGSRVISAVNEGDEYQLTDLDPALVSRFNIYRFSPTVEEWLLWARTENLDERVIDFISVEPNFLDSDGKNEYDSLDKSPDRRGWEKVSQCIKGVKTLEALHAKMISGIVGEKACAKFISFAYSNSSVSGKKLLEGFKKVREKISAFQIHQYAALNDSILSFLDSLRSNMPGADICKNYGENLEHYMNYLVENQQNEILAQIASHIANNTNPGATSFMRKYSPSVFQICIDTVSKM